MREAELKAKITMQDLTKGGVDSAFNGIQKLGTAIKGFIGYEVFKKAVEFVGDLNTAFGESETAMYKLQAASKNNPLLSGDFAKSFGDYASQMQMIIGVEDEAIVTQAAYAASLGRSEAQIKDMTRAAADWAATGQVSFESAFQNLNRSYSGQLGMMGRILPGLKDMTEEQLKMGGAVQFVSKAFEGMSANIYKGVEGSRKLAEIAGGELKESLGKMTAPIEIFFNRGFAELSKIVSGQINKGLTEVDTSKWFRDFIFNMLRASTQVRETFTNIVNWVGAVITRVFSLMQLEIEKIKLGLLAITQKGSPEWKAQFNTTAGVLRETQRPLTESGDWNNRGSETMTKMYDMYYKNNMTLDQIKTAILAQGKGQSSKTKDDLSFAYSQFATLFNLLPDETRDAVKKGAAAGVQDGMENPEVAKKWADQFADKLGEEWSDLPFGMGAVGMFGAGTPAPNVNDVAPETDSSIGDRVVGLFGNVVQAFAKGGIVAGIFAVIESMQSLKPIFDVVGTALAEVDKFLTPLVAALDPLFDFVMLFANIIGHLLNPFIKIFAMVMQALTPVIVFVANVLIVLANIVIVVGNVLHNVGIFFENIGIDVHNAFTWLTGKKKKKRKKYVDLDEGTMGLIDEDELDDQSNESAATTTDSGTAAQYTQGRTINITVNIYDPIIADGDSRMRNLALMIKQELMAAEAVA